MRFNLVHVHADPRLHCVSGFAEVIETLRWGLEQFGHEVAVRRNGVDPASRNIVFGYQLLPPDVLKSLPAETIIYSFEQMAGVPPDLFRPPVHEVAARFQIWDYCQANISAWNALKPRFAPIHVPVGWSPTIAKIPRREQDIDVLLYGVPGGARSQIFEKIAMQGLVSLFVCGLYGDARDELIARSRIILNISRMATHMLEVVRVSYLLANGKAVVSDWYPDSIIEPDFRDAMAFASLDQIPALCVRLVGDESLRRQLEALGPQVMQRRDIRQILATAITQTP